MYVDKAALFILQHEVTERLLCAGPRARETADPDAAPALRGLLLRREGRKCPVTWGAAREVRLPSSRDLDPKEYSSSGQRERCKSRKPHRKERAGLNV